MARGRFISRSITTDKAVDGLSCDTSRLAFTWLIVFADVEGRVNGDPALIKAMLFPRRQGMSVSKISKFIDEWSNAGIVNRYKVGIEVFLEFPNFAKHQKGIRKDREAASEVPPNPELLPINSGVTPEQNGLSISISSKNKNKQSISEEEVPPPSNEDAGGSANNSACIWCNSPKEDASGVQYLMQRWHDLYKKQVGYCPTIQPGKDSNILKRLLTAGRSEEVIETALTRYLSDDDSFIVKQGHALGIFATRFDGYRTERINSNGGNNNAGTSFEQYGAFLHGNGEPE